MSSQTQKIGNLIVSVWISLFMYILLHEFGHLIIALLCGSTITEFSILKAHVSFTGGIYNGYSSMFLHSAGVLFPVICLFVYLLVYRDFHNNWYKMFSYIVCVMPICSLLAWVFVPVLYVCNQAPIGDDVTKFLDIFDKSFHPLMVSVFASIVIIVLVMLVVKKGIIRNFKEVMKE